MDGQRFRYYVTHVKCKVTAERAAYRIAADAIERHCLTIFSEHQASQVPSIDQVDTAAWSSLSAGEQRELLM